MSSSLAIKTRAGSIEEDCEKIDPSLIRTPYMNNVKYREAGIAARVYRPDGGTRPFHSPKGR